MIKTTLLLICVSSAAFSQGPDDTNIKDTLRFIRLAETKKNLSFSEEKLLKVNEILDDVEARHIDQGKKERELRRQIDQGGLSENQAKAILDDFRNVRKAQSDLEFQLFDRIQEVLTPLESIEFFVFYYEFKQKIARRINMLKQDQRPMDQRPMKRRR